MTKAKISEYDPSASNNTDVNGVNIAEGCAPSGINDAIREVMAALKRFETGSDGDSVTVGGNLVVSGEATVSNTFTASLVNVDNLSFDGNTISSTDESGNIVIAPNSLGQVIVNAGAVGTPIIAPTGDTNTGIFFPAADTIAFTEGGAEAMRISDSSKLLVGHTSDLSFPAASRLLVAGVDGNSGASFARCEDSSTPVQLYLGKGRGTIESPTIVQDNDDLGSIRFVGYDGNDFVSRAGQIQCAVDGTPGADDMPGRLEFLVTADGAATPTEQMRLTSTGELRFNSGYGSVAAAFGCRAWVHFDGTLSAASMIKGSGNVSSITDQGTGDYRVNFATAMPDANYSAVMFHWRSVGTGSLHYTSNLNNAAAYVDFETRVGSTAANVDFSDCNVAILR